MSAPIPTNSSASGSPTPATPPKRRVASFDNLVALANYHESLAAARKLVWRDRGQPVVDLPTLQACLDHAAGGGARAAGLAWGIRALVNLVLALIRVRSLPKEKRLPLLRKAIFGLDTWRFAGMLGSFAAIYKFLLNALPILIPAIRPRSVLFPTTNGANGGEELDLEKGLNTGEFLEVPTSTGTRRLSLSHKTQMILIRKKTRRWHAALAGAIAGLLAIQFESPSRRYIIAQQLFVRGLQGSYNSYSTKYGFHVPSGEVWVFALACGQILYAWLLRPDSIPRSYATWVGQAAMVPRECVRINNGLVREQAIDLKDVDTLINRHSTTASNRSKLLEFRSLFSPAIGTTTATPTGGTYVPHYAPCSAVHPVQSSCLEVPLNRFFKVFKWMLPVYGALHFIPPILLKFQAFKREPVKKLWKALLGTGRSSAFLGAFVVIYQTFNCAAHQLHEYLSTLPKTNPLHRLGLIPRQAILDALLISKYTFWLPGFLAGLALFIEEDRRRAELAMYVLPKALESAWIITSGRVGPMKWFERRKGLFGGEGLLSAVAMGMTMATYQNDPQHLSTLVRKIMYQFIGPN